MNYVADGTGSDLTEVTLSYRHAATGTAFQLEDFDGDGIATALLSRGNLVSGIYELDGASFVDQGNNRVNLGSNDLASVDFDDLELIGGKIPLIDTVAPTLSSVTTVTDTVNFGELAIVSYVADGTGSDLGEVKLWFKDAASGNEIVMQDFDGDGNVTELIDSSSLVSGTYDFVSGVASDQGNNDLQLDSSAFDASITLVVPSITEAQTDYEAPNLDDFGFLPDIA